MPQNDVLSDREVLKVVEFGLREAAAAGFGSNIPDIAGSVMIALDQAGYKVARPVSKPEQGNMRPESPLELAEELASCAKSDGLRFSDVRVAGGIVPQQAVFMAETVTGQRFRVTVTRMLA